VVEAVEAVVLRVPLPEMVALVVLEVDVVRLDLLLERDLATLVERMVVFLLQMVGVMMVDLEVLTLQEAVEAHQLMVMMRELLMVVHIMVDMVVMV
jgi:hypothetical protein